MADGGPRMTIPTQLVLRALLEDPARELYGVEIGAAAGLPSGTVHPILARLEGLRWVESRWEDIDTRAEGRPARRYTGSPPPGSPLPGRRWPAPTGQPGLLGCGRRRSRHDPAAGHLVLPDHTDRPAQRANPRLGDHLDHEVQDCQFLRRSLGHRLTVDGSGDRDVNST